MATPTNEYELFVNANIVDKVNYDTRISWGASLKLPKIQSIGDLGKVIQIVHDAFTVMEKTLNEEFGKEDVHT